MTAIQNPILNQQLKGKYADGMPSPNHVEKVYFFFAPPPATQCFQWNKYEHHDDWIVHEKTTIQAPKSKAVFSVPNAVVCSEPQMLLSEATKLVLDRDLVRINQIKKTVFIMKFGYFIGKEDISLANLDTNLYESACEICMKICGSVLTKEQVRHHHVPFVRCQPDRKSNLTLLWFTR